MNNPLKSFWGDGPGTLANTTMLVAELSFELLPGDDGDEVVGRVYDLIGTLRRNGNVLSVELLWRAQNKLSAHVAVPERDSISPNNLSARAKQTLADGERRYLLTCRILGPVAEGVKQCSCPEPRAFALFTNFLDCSPPLRCIECFGYVPLYHIPAEESGDFNGLLQWEANYKACDTLQMLCTVGETFAEREMSNLNSRLSRSGIESCADIEKRTGKPTYYYLYRGSGRNVQAERQKKCPSCGGEWLLSETLFGKFDFRCDRCHLLSNVAFNLR